MAIMQMQRIQICALKKDRKKILELLQRRGIVEIDERIEPDALVTKTDTSQTSAVFAKNAAAAAEALRVLQEYAPEKNSMLSSLEGKSVETVATYNAFYKVSHAVTDIALRIVQLQRAIAEKKGEAAKLRGQIQALVPWLGLDAPLNYDGTRAVKAFVGYFPMETELSELLTRLAEQDPELPPVHVEIVGHALNQTLVFVLCRREQGKQVESALRGLGFSYPPVSAGKPPKERIDEIKDEIRACEDGIAADEKELLDYVPRREDLKFAVDYFNMRKEKYEVLGRLSQTKHAFFITGYIPMQAADAIARELAEAYGAHVEISDLEPDEERPVLLRNNKFAAPVEGVVESFGLPKRGEIDPCSITAFFYYILFGLMFSDAAYGMRVRLNPVQEHVAEHAQFGAAVPLLRPVHHLLGADVRRLLRRFSGSRVHNLFQYLLENADVVVQHYGRADADARVLHAAGPDPSLHRPCDSVLSADAPEALQGRGIRRGVLVRARHGARLHPARFRAVPGHCADGIPHPARRSHGKRRGRRRMRCGHYRHIGPRIARY